MNDIIICGALLVLFFLLLKGMDKYFKFHYGKKSKKWNATHPTCVLYLNELKKTMEISHQLYERKEAIRNHIDSLIRELQYYPDDDTKRRAMLLEIEEDKRTYSAVAVEWETISDKEDSLRKLYNEWQEREG